MTTIATLFGGFGGVDIGAMAAGLEPAWSIEYDAAVADVARTNLRHRVHVADLMDCDPTDFEAVDVLHASPPCPNFSVANAQSSETETDIALARKVAEFVTVLRPAIFTLENVWAYRHSRSWATIEDALHGAGYWLHLDHVNAADMGVPQTRKRMIVRAVRGGFVPYLPEAQPWIGWYEAIEDLLPTLPDSQFAPWQLARLPEQLSQSLLMQVQHMQRALLIGGGNASRELTLRDGDRPSITVTTGGTKEPMRAWLVNESSTMEVRAAEGSSAAQVASSRNSAQRALLDHGHVVAMTPRALARFQSFPDWYELPANARLAAKGIGNAVPPLLYQRIITPLLEPA